MEHFCVDGAIHWVIRGIPLAADLERRRLELKYQLRFRLVEAMSKAFDQLIPGAAAVLCPYFGIFRPVHDLAGRQTLATFGLALFADVKPDERSLVGWFFGINAQRLRRNTTERLTNRIQELKRKIDPNRTTSGLTPCGRTPVEDQ